MFLVINYALSFLFGLIIGSFLNVLILRYHSGQSLGGRSHCLFCGQILTWFELLPVASFVIQRGRCRRCQSKISWQYPLVEILTGLLFVLTFARFGFNNWLEISFYWVIVSLLVPIIIYDLRHKIIPDIFVFGIGVLALIKPLLTVIEAGAYSSLWTEYQTIFLGGVIAGGIFLLLWLLSCGRWLGFGDVKLALVAGFLLGWPQVFSALILAVWIGAMTGLVLIFLTKIKLFGFSKYFTIKSELPFAPFIILGIILNLFFQINVF
ncbi:MAG: prepilin peptidase [Candidatus Paceibacterota bacterium]|jgi:prepilin signal peptidase PulO-like enzyme (type II secretory pathway)